jgi:hypothetical protein
MMINIKYLPQISPVGQQESSVCVDMHTFSGCRYSF